MSITGQMGEQGFRWFVGIVEQINDPLQLGRAKVRIINEHDDNVTTDDLDWAHPIVPTTSAGADGVGETPSLVIGTRVFGFFLDGDEKQMPMILGCIPTIPDNDQNRHSLSWLARGKNTIDKHLIGPEPQSSYAAQYPYNKTIASKSGHVIELDDTPENERVHIYHNSGSYVEINKNGDVVYKSVNDMFNIAANNSNIHVEGNMIITVVGDALIQCPNVTIDSKKVLITGDVQVGGRVVATGDVVGNGVFLSTHTHGGVDSGNSNTDQPN